MLERTAKQGGYWIDPGEFRKKWVEGGSLGGSEHDLYREGDYAIKANNLHHHGSWSEYLDRILIHNALITEDAYEIIGVTRDIRNGEIAIVSRQAIIDEADRSATLADIRSVLTVPESEGGIGAVNDGTIYHHYYLDDEKIQIRDARIQNAIIDLGGEVHVFDAVFTMMRAEEMADIVESRDVPERKPTETQDKDDALFATTSSTNGGTGKLFASLPAIRGLIISPADYRISI